MNIHAPLFAALTVFVIPLVAEDGLLPPGSMLLPESALPEYETDIDHARLIREHPKAVIKLGQETYQQVCHNCHGDVNLPGSIPNSLRFAEGKFHHGNDPYTMYQTLTRGWRLMVPQVQLTPREKYAVIHYIRDHFLQEHNPDQLFEVTDDYLTSLPTGKSLGPVPVKREPWKDMDYGPFLIGTFELSTEEERSKPWPKGSEPDYVSPDANIAYKAVAIRLDSGPGGVAAGSQWVAFEHDTLRVAGAWTGEGFIDWHGINFDGRHVVRPRTVGEPVFETADGPGWANPTTGKFDDLRFEGLDGRKFGPLPREWGRFGGIYKLGNSVVVKYSVGDATIFESHQMSSSGGLVRQLNVGRSSKDLTLRLANAGIEAFVEGSTEVKIETADGFVMATIPAAATPVNLAFTMGKAKDPNPAQPEDLRPMTAGGPAQWPEVQEAVTIRGDQDGAFQWDSFAMPNVNPWKSRLRASGIDFTPDGKAAIVCCWDGDVWRVDGIADESAATAKWRRIASGLYQPLGVKVMSGEILVTCRDQIVRLQDLNGDGETDFYENFNSDHQVTEHFHEFAMGLQGDEKGNLYYAKSGRHARPPLVAHHGTLLKVSADGKETTILANGFRAANGVCRNPDGTFFVTDQEGHWNPMNRINLVKAGDHFYGNMWSYGAPEDNSDAAMEQPLCWVDKSFDRSPSELLWVDSEKWGNLNGKLLHLSYGHGRLEIVPHETVDGQVQGGLSRLPIPDFPTGTMRGRFHPGNGHLYLCGMAAWGTAQMQLPGGFYRVRATGKPMHLPIGLRATKSGVEITFSDPLDPESVLLGRELIEVQSWALKRSANYGSKHYDEKSHTVKSATLSEDGTELALELSEMSPVWQMSIRYRFKGANGDPVEGEIQNTIHRLAE
ncbi:MAG: c-type cytochrome [Verrucomicrobiales bacterium]|nr:c-type cytochrome [Verrucomicrobiales bacterium]